MFLFFRHSRIFARQEKTYCSAFKNKKDSGKGLNPKRGKLSRMKIPVKYQWLIKALAMRRIVSSML